jgi:hypothetical protein
MASASDFTVSPQLTGRRADGSPVGIVEVLAVGWVFLFLDLAWPIDSKHLYGPPIRGWFGKLAYSNGGIMRTSHSAVAASVLMLGLLGGVAAPAAATTSSTAGIFAVGVNSAPVMHGHGDGTDMTHDFGSGSDGDGGDMTHDVI